MWAPATKLANKKKESVSMSKGIRESVCLVAILVGCGSSPEATGETADELGLMECHHRVEDAGSVRVFDARYSKLELEAWLGREPDVAQALRLNQISSCEDALAAMTALQTKSLQTPEDPSLLDESAKEETPITPPTEKIFFSDGTNTQPHSTTFRSAVWIPSLNCSGFMLNSKAVVTAAHCVDGKSGTNPSTGIATTFNSANASDQTLNMPLTIKLWRPDLGAFVCSSTTACGTTTARVTMLGAYVGSGNSDSDIALIVRTAGTWANASTADYAKIYRGSFNAFSSYFANGAGVTSDAGTDAGSNMRLAGMGLDSFGSYAYTANARTGRLCSGDSGGPATWSNGLLDFVIGIHSKSTHSDSPTDQCANSPGTQTGMRMGGNKFDWVNGKLGNICDGAKNSGGVPYGQCF